MCKQEVAVPNRATVYIPTIIYCWSGVHAVTRMVAVPNMTTVYIPTIIYSCSGGLEGAGGRIECAFAFEGAGGDPVFPAPILITVKSRRSEGAALFFHCTHSWVPKLR